MPPQERDRPDSLISKRSNSVAPFTGLLDPEALESETDAPPGVESEIVQDKDELADLVSGETVGVGDDEIPSLSSLLQYIMCMLINFILHMLGVNFVLGIFGLALKPLDDLRSVELKIKKSKDKKRKLQEMQMTKDESSLSGDGKRTKLDYHKGEEVLSSEPEPVIHSSLDKELSDSEESRATAEFENRSWNLKPDLNFGSAGDWSNYHFESTEKWTEPSALSKNLENTLGEKKEVLKVITPTDSFNDVLNLSGDISDTATGDEINDVAFGDSSVPLKIAIEHEDVRDCRVEDEGILVSDSMIRLNDIGNKAYLIKNEIPNTGEVQMDVEDEWECDSNNVESPPVIVQDGEECQEVLDKHAEELIHSKSFQGNDGDLFTKPEEIIQNIVEEVDFQTHDDGTDIGQSSFLEDTEVIGSEIVGEEGMRYLQCKEKMNSENLQIQLHQKLSRSPGQNSNYLTESIDIQTSSMDINEGDDLSNNVAVSNGEGKNIEESSVLAIDIVGNQEYDAEIEDEKLKSSNILGQSYTQIGESEYASVVRLGEEVVENYDSEGHNRPVLCDEENVNFNDKSLANIQEDSNNVATSVETSEYRYQLNIALTKPNNRYQVDSLKNEVHSQGEKIETACVSNTAYSEEAIEEKVVELSTEAPGEVNHSTGEFDDGLLSVNCQDGKIDNFSIHENHNIEGMRDENLYDNDSIIKSNITNDTELKVENASVVPIEKSGRTEAKCEEVQSKEGVRRGSEGSKGRRGQKSSGKKKKKRNLL